MEALKLILLIVAALALLKAVWLLLWPAGVKSTVDWWLKMPAPASRLIGYGAMAAGLVLIVMAIMKMADPVIAATTVLGTVCVVFGMFYQWPAVFAALNKPFGSEGKDWVIRTTGVVLLVVALLLAYICLRDGSGA
jgi:protein-S-isoprenylcysteine O-methyltransferase Ste14